MSKYIDPNKYLFATGIMWFIGANGCVAILITTISLFVQFTLMSLILDISFVILTITCFFIAKVYKEEYENN